MFLSRTVSSGPDGNVPRILASQDPTNGWVDVRTAERRRLERKGASPAAATRIAEIVVPGSTTQALENGSSFLDAAHDALADTSGDIPMQCPEGFISPIDPPSYRDFMAFEEHFSFGYKWRGLPVPDVLYEFPVGYLGAPQSFLAPGEEIPWPHYAEQLDYELELGIVIGRTAKDVTPDAALDHVLGLTILNDVSARDIQRREMESGLGPAKGKHFGSVAGPWIATLDELDPGNLRMSVRVNDDLRCETNSGEMIWSVAELVSWAAAAETLPAGALLGSGTANGGSGVEAGKLLAPGDVIDMRIDKLGSLVNRVAHRGSGWIPQPRLRAVARAEGSR